MGLRNCMRKLKNEPRKKKKSFKINFFTKGVPVFLPITHKKNNFNLDKLVSRILDTCTAWRGHTLFD